MEIFLLLIGVLFVLPLFLMVWHTIRLARLSAEIDVVAARVARIEKTLAGATVATPAVAVAPPVAEREPAPPPPPPSVVEPAGVEAPPPALEAEVEPAAAAASPPTVPTAAAPALPAPGLAASPSTAAPSLATPGPAPEAPAHTTPRLAPEAPALVIKEATSLEGRIGGRWLLYLGVGALVLATAWLLKFAFDNAWITPAMRVALGGVGGLALIAIGLRFVRRGYSLYGHVLSGGGIAALYLSIYAALDYYHLIGQVTAFALMTVVTSGAAVLANRHASQGLALAAVIGGFATPFLVGDQSGSAWVLFGYDTLLVSATMYLARRRDWPALNLTSCGLTVLTMISWAAASWTSQDRLVTQVFLVVFSALFIGILREYRGRAGVLAWATRAALSGAVGLAHVGSVFNLAGHEPSLIVYLVVLSLIGLVVIPPDRPGWRLALWLGVMLPFLAMADASARELGPLVLGGTLASLYVMHQAAQLRAITSTAEPSRTEIVLLHAVGLGTALGAASFLAEMRLDLLPLATLVLAGQTLGVAAAIRGRAYDAALHYLALAATLAAIAVSQQFDGAWVTAGWITQGAALSWLGLKTKRGWPRVVGGLVLLYSVAQVTTVLTEPPTLGQLVLLNPPALTGLYLAVLFLVLARLHERLDWTDRSKAMPAALPAALTVSAQLVGLMVLTFEVNAWFSARGAGTSDDVTLALARAASLIVSWALAGAAVSATGLGRGYVLVRLLGGLVLGVAVLQLVLLLQGVDPPMPAPPPGYVVLFNARGLATLWTCATLLAVARMYRNAAETLPGRGVRENTVLVLTAAVVGWGFLSVEANAFWELRDPGREGYFARQVTLSIVWAGYALALVAIGMWRRFAPVRYLAIGLLGVTVVKAIIVDVGSLSPAYRIASAMGLGVLLLVTSYLYQRYKGESRPGG